MKRKKQRSLGAILLAGLAPPPDLSIEDWAADNIVLGERQPSKFRGKYRASLTPYVRGIFDVIQDPAYEQVTIQKGGQVGLSLAMHVACLWQVVNDPGPTLFVMPTEASFRTTSEQRLTPLIRDSPTVAAEVLPGRDTMRISRYQFRRCNLDFSGANSPVGLASRPVRYLYLDETSKFPVDVANEASPVALSIQRTKTFEGCRKIVLASTPTLPDDYICQNFKAGDQRYYHVPCPKCGTFQKLEWARVKFDSKADPETAGAGAYYLCQNEACGHHWTDSEKTDALQLGKWVAENPSVKKHASFHLSSLYAPWVKWGNLVESFMKKKDFTNELRDFVNSDLGEPWIEKVEQQTMNLVERAAVNYGRDTLTLSPSESVTITLPSGDETTFAALWEGKQTATYMTCDVQKTDVYWLVRRWATGGDSALVAWGVVQDWFDLDATARNYGVKKVFVDAGYGERTSEVYQACIQFLMIPVQGKSNLKNHYQITSINPYEGTRRQVEGETIGIVYQQPDISKSMLADLMLNRGKRRWLVYSPIEAEYIQQMQSEIKSGGRWIQRKGKDGKDNHLWDCECMSVLAAAIGGFFDLPKPETAAKPRQPHPDEGFVAPMI